MPEKGIAVSRVAMCEVAECAYNSNRACHAYAITVGDGMSPRCDTFLRSPQHTLCKDTAWVGACKMMDCRYNQDFECTAESIEVGSGPDSADCMTYEER